LQSSWRSMWERSVATTTSTANLAWVKAHGCRYRHRLPPRTISHHFSDYDVVLNSLGGEVLEKSLRVLKPGGKLISISGPPVRSPERHGIVLDLETVHAPVELSNQEESKTSSRELFFSFHESQWRSVARSVTSSILDYRPVVDRLSFERPTRLWLTSKEDMPKARLSSG